MVPVNHLPELAFDHRTIVEYAINRLRGKIESPDIATRLVGERFTLSQLHDVYEAIAGQRIDLANFRRKMLASGLLEDTGEKLRIGRNRPAGGLPVQPEAGNGFVDRSRNGIRIGRHSNCFPG